MNKYVSIGRFGTENGFYQFSDVQKLAEQLIEAGFTAVVEMAPGAPLEGLNVFYLRVPEDQFLEAKRFFHEKLKL
ncbi:MAG: hypothetical protein VX642_09510 [Bdellovibrionota bacterium]|nr:hypothetical protein [Bdellovibrionota bacterium]